MPQPYDYTIRPTGQSPIRTASGLIGLQQNYQQQQQQQAEQQRQAQFRMGLQQLDPNDPAAAQALAQQYPGQIEQIQGFQGFANEQQQMQVRDAAGGMITAAQSGDPELLQQTIDQYAPVISGTGNPSITPEVLKRIARNKPETFLQMMQGSYGRAGGDLKQLGIKDVSEAPAAIKESQWFLDLPEEQQQKLLKYKGRGGPDVATKNELNRANDILKNPTIFTPGEIQWAQGITGSGQPIAEALYGGLSSEKANKYLENAEGASSAHKQLSRQLSLLEDMKDSDLSLKGATAQNFMQSWFGEVLGMSPAEAERQVAAVQTGNFDIARQLAKNLKPASDSDMKNILQSLQGGNLDGAIQAIRSTLKQSEEDFSRNRRLLDINRAGIVDELPEKLTYERTKDVIGKEDIEFGYAPKEQPPTPAADQIIPDDVLKLSDDELKKALKL